MSAASTASAATTASTHYSSGCESICASGQEREGRSERAGARAELCPRKPLRDSCISRPISVQSPSNLRPISVQSPPYISAIHLRPISVLNLRLLSKLATICRPIYHANPYLPCDARDTTCNMQATKHYYYVVPLGGEMAVDMMADACEVNMTSYMTWNMTQCDNVAE